MSKQFRKESIYCVNKKLDKYDIAAQVMALEPPCVVGILYHNDEYKEEIEEFIENYIPLGVECKFIKDGD